MTDKSISGDSYSKTNDVIVDVVKGFASVEDTINHLNAPPLRAD